MRRCFLLIALAAGSISAQEKCLPCHEAEVKAFAQTGMGRSIAQSELPTVSFQHKPSHSSMAVQFRGGQMYHRVERNGLTAEYPIAIGIGSGNVGHSYAVLIGGSLFESPISWFSQPGRWDLSPGYGGQTNPGFDRRITMECLYCHTGGMRQGTDAPHSITCERCHAASATHFANPAKLPPAARDSICEQCHLQGEARILNPGSTWNDSRPAFTTYTSPGPGTAGVLKVVSQVEQLALSKCARMSEGKLWCGTCHSPHGVKKDQRQVCLSCHAGALPASHPNGAKDCASCHMPRRQTPEIAHTSYTDHRIRSNRDDPAAGYATRVLRAWREPLPEYRGRNLGLAYLYAGQRDSSVNFVQEGFKILLPLKNKDAEVLAGIGWVLMQKQRPKEAAENFEQAVRLQPEDARHAHNLGVALFARGDTQAAIAELERAIKLDPLDELAYSVLVQMYIKSGQKKLSEDTIARYLAVVPQSLTFRTR